DTKGDAVLSPDCWVPGSVDPFSTQHPEAGTLPPFVSYGVLRVFVVCRTVGYHPHRPFLLFTPSNCAARVAVPLEREAHRARTLGSRNANLNLVGEAQRERFQQALAVDHHLRRIALRCRGQIQTIRTARAPKIGHRCSRTRDRYTELSGPVGG